MKSVIRLLAAKQVTDPATNDKDRTWQKKMDQHYHGQPRKPGRVTDEGTFTKSPSAIANELKNKSEDYGQASSKLNGYINRRGKDLQGADKNRLYDAKEALKDSFGVQSGSESPIFNPTPWVQQDAPALDTGFDMDQKDKQFALASNAAKRLVMAKHWSQNVTEHDDHNAVPEGTFTKSAEDIAHTLKRVSKDHGQAAERLNFYKNRGGANVDHAKLDKASHILKGLYGDS